MRSIGSNGCGMVRVAQQGGHAQARRGEGVGKSVEVEGGGEVCRGEEEDGKREGGESGRQTWGEEGGRCGGHKCSWRGKCSKRTGGLGLPVRTDRVGDSATGRTTRMVGWKELKKSF